METYITSDSHFGHANICNFLREDGTKLRPWINPDDMDDFMVSQWNSVVKPTDQVIHLGDVVMNRRCLTTLDKLNGKKILILGNHDIFDHSDYLKYFKRLHGSMKLDNLLLTHIPVHTDSIARWALANAHGHIHEKVISDAKYINLCVEQTDYRPLALYEVKERAVKAQAAQQLAATLALDTI